MKKLDEHLDAKIEDSEIGKGFRQNIQEANKTEYSVQHRLNYNLEGESADDIRQLGGRQSELNTIPDQNDVSQVVGQSQGLNRADTGELIEDIGHNNLSQIQLNQKLEEEHQQTLKRDFEKKQTKKAEKANRCATCCS